MAKTIKSSGQVFTPEYIVRIILDFGGYTSREIRFKHIIDNSCGNGAFLSEIVKRYCHIFYAESNDTNQLKTELETYVHGIEIDPTAYGECLKNLNKTAAGFGIGNVNWDIRNEDALFCEAYNGKMDFVVGNPPYVRVHNLENYESVKKYRFADKGMTDLFIVFFEIGFNMLAPNGKMSVITPSSWLSSKAGCTLRKYISTTKKLTGIIDLEHFQAFNATTYTIISRFENAEQNPPLVNYNTFDPETLSVKFREELQYADFKIGENFYFSQKEDLAKLRKILLSKCPRAVSVKNGFATLADKIFIGKFPFSEHVIRIVKASTGEWKECIFPYDGNAVPIPSAKMEKSRELWNYLLANKSALEKRDTDDKNSWFLFGRTQAIKDVFKNKIAVNSIIKDKGSIKLNAVKKGEGVYSGLYILTDIGYDSIAGIIISEDFLQYIKLLKNYKSGGYYTFSSKDLEKYINYKITEYEQPRISGNNLTLF